MHVATSTIEQLLDYVMNTPADGFSTAETVKTLNRVIENNQTDVLLQSILASSGKKRSK
jgi:4-O-beta-D-mannosyl-D-glucose phosphorylase